MFPRDVLTIWACKIKKSYTFQSDALSILFLILLYYELPVYIRVYQVYLHFLFNITIETEYWLSYTVTNRILDSQNSNFLLRLANAIFSTISML